MWLLDRLEAWDKKNYNKVFNKFKTVVCKKHKGDLTNKQIRECLENELEIAYDFKADFVYELNDDDLIVDNLYEFTEFFSKNVDRLV